MKKITRRSFLQATAALSVATAFAACSADTSVSSSSVAASSAAASSSSEADSASSEAASSTVTVSVLNGEGAYVDVEFPVAPKSVAVLNYQTLDFMDAMGLQDCISGVITGSLPAHLAKYKEMEGVVSLGSMKDIDIEALAALAPEVIFSSDRTASSYDTFSAIAPTMSCAIAYGEGFMNSYKNLAERHAAIFGIGDETGEIIADYEARIQAISDEFAGSTALLAIFASGLNTLGDTGRCSVISNEMGFVNMAADKNVNHGNALTYEGFLELNPEYIFVIDKDAAVGTEAVEAKQQMDNEIIHETDAYKNGKIIYLEPGDAWYLCDGGITAMDLMLAGLEEQLGMA